MMNDGANEDAEEPLTKEVKDEPEEQDGNPSEEVQEIPEPIKPPKEREAWRNKREYLLALIGLLIGLGNIWRFPYLLQKNGGAAFLIPCLFFIFFAGIPMFLMELAIGQRMRRGCVGSLNAISPYLTGIGISAGFVAGSVSLYYNTLLAWVISYFISSWTFPKLPWTDCQNYSQTDEWPLYRSILDGSNHTFAYPVNVTEDRPNQECELASPAQYFWFRETLDVSSDITDYGNWNWWMFSWQILAWIIVCLCLTWGTDSQGKVAYFTGIFPFVVLTIFLVRGFFLKDFVEGFQILFAPKWGKLLQGKVWLDAGTQILFGLNVGFGIVMTFGSYSPPHNGCHRDAFIVPLISFVTSLWASCIMFMILGFKGMKEYRHCLKDRQGVVQSLLDIDGLLRDQFSRNWTLKSINFPNDHFISTLNITLSNENGSEIVADVWGSPENRDDMIYAKFCDKESIIRNTGSGTGLIFITFAEAVTSFPAPQLWSIIFLIMLISLGLGSQNGMVEGVISAVVDLKLFRGPKWRIVLGVCIGFGIFAVVGFSPGNGVYLLTFFDDMVVGWPMLFVTLSECVAVSYFYGLDRLSYEIKIMTGYRPNSYLLLCWRIISPLLILIILVFSLVFQLMEGATYQRWRSDLGMNDNAHWKGGYLALAVILDLIILGWIPAVAILTYFGIRILKEPQEIFPEEKLKELRKYDPVEDERTISSFQRAIMARSIKDARIAWTKSKKEEGTSTGFDMDRELNMKSKAGSVDKIGEGDQKFVEVQGVINDNKKSLNDV